MDDKIFAVADFFLANADPDDPVTHLKLQKLCAYAQAFSLALLDKPLFGDALEAWQHGPVIRRLYMKYKDHENLPIATKTIGVDSRRLFDDEELYVLETVNSYYGAYAPHRLRAMSHDDFPRDFNAITKQIIPVADISSRFRDHKVINAIREALA